MGGIDPIFESKAAEERHQENLFLQRAILSELKKDKTTDNGTSGIKESIGIQIKALEKLVTVITTAPKQLAPVVNIETDNQEIVGSFRHIADQISMEITSLKDSLAKLEWKEMVFTVNRNPAGFIQTLKVIKR